MDLTVPPTARARTPARILGGAIDSMIRGARTDPTRADALAERVLRLWKEAELAPLTLDATTVRVGDQVILTATAEQGPWILPAFMSGLREVRPRRELSVDELRVLAERVGALEANAAALAGFQDWLWTEGAEGFEVRMEPSFVEMLDTRAAETGHGQRGFAAVRAEGLFSLGTETVAVQAADLDAAALRPEMAIPLADYVAAAGRRELEISGATMRALAAACDDAEGWATAEVAAIISNPALRSAFSPERLGRRLLARLRVRAGHQVLVALVTLSRDADPYAHRVWSVLEGAAVGSTIAASVPLDEVVAVAALVDLAAQLPPRVATELVRGLLTRAIDTPAAVRVLTDLWERLGADFAPHATSPQTSPAEAEVLAAVAVRAGARSPQIAALVEALPTSAALAFLVTAPPGYAAAAVAQMPRLVAEGTPAALIALAARLRSQELIDRVLTRLRADGGRGWSGKVVGTLTAAAIATGFAPTLAALVRSRRLTPEVRLDLLEALADRPEPLDRAIRWSPATLLDPAEVRHALAAARRRRRTTR